MVHGTPSSFPGLFRMVQLGVRRFPARICAQSLLHVARVHLAWIVHPGLFAWPFGTPHRPCLREATYRPARHVRRILVPGFRLKDLRRKERAELSSYFFMTASSEAILPSRIKIIRCACWAMSFSWVTRIIVLPCR